MRFASPVQLDSGLIIPAGAAAGKVLTSDGSGNATWGIGTPGWHAPVRACSPPGTNITVASPGATIDGVTMVAGDRVLLRDQTTASQNGIYVWNGAAVAMTRATDADTTGELITGDIITVTEGAKRGFNKFQIATTGVITIGTTAIDFDPFLSDSDYKRSVRAATTANIATILTAPGATIDGVTMAAGDRFLAKDQTTAAENGIYTWASATACSRSGENNTQSKTGSGMLVFVEEGTVNVSTEWRLTTFDPIIPGTTAQVWANVSRRASAVGVLTFTWPGGTGISNVIVVNHNLNVTPRTNMVTPNDSILSCGITARSTTTLSVQARTVDATVKALGSFGAAYWWAEA